MEHNHKNIYLATLSAGLVTSCGYRLAKGLVTDEKRIAQIQRGKDYFKLVQEGIDYTKNWKAIGLSFDPHTIEKLNALTTVISVTGIEDSRGIENFLGKVNTTLNVLDKEDSINQQEIIEISNFFSKLSESVRYGKRECCRMLN